MISSWVLISPGAYTAPKQKSEPMYIFYQTEATEVILLWYIGYSVVALGNSEIENKASNIQNSK